MKHIINGKRTSSNDYLLNFLRSEIQRGDSLLDLGCGPKLYSDPFKGICKKIITIDAWPEVNPDIVANLENVDIELLLNYEKFDYVLMLDFIEHLSKEAGLRLIDSVKKLTKKKIILLTPLEEIWDDNHKNVYDSSLWSYGNIFDLHKSMWAHSDFLNWQPVSIKSLTQYYIGTFSNV